MGAYILLYPRVHVHMLIIIIVFVTTIAVPAYLMLGYWLLLQILSGWASSNAQGGGVAFWAHTGGFIAGGLLTFVFRDRQLLARHPFHGWRQTSTPSRSWRRIDQ
jgi:membrane associated rhomboid family serine protease